MTSEIGPSGYRLFPYLQHLGSCKYRFTGDCDCGLSEIRAALRSETDSSKLNRIADQVDADCGLSAGPRPRLRSDSPVPEGRDNAESLLASATDLANTYAREHGVEEAASPEGIKGVIERLAWKLAESRRPPKGAVPEGYGDPRWFAYTEKQWAFFSSPEAADLWLGAANGGIRGPFYPGPAYSESRLVPADSPEELNDEE